MTKSQRHVGNLVVVVKGLSEKKEFYAKHVTFDSVILVLEQTNGLSRKSLEMLPLSA